MFFIDISNFYSQLYLECGVENKILSVSEPEKCEYVMKMTTPAICPENFEGNNDHDELQKKITMKYFFLF